MAARASALEKAIVLDFTPAAGGTGAACLLGLLGARVLRIESPLRAHPAAPGADSSTKTVSLDFTDPRGLELALGLVEQADIAVAELGPGLPDGLGHDELRERNDRLVVVSVSVGSTEPAPLDDGDAAIFAALGGLARLTGYPAGPPADVGHSVESSVGLFVALAAVAGLLRRANTGRGVSIEVSPNGAEALLVGDALLDLQLTDRVPSRTGNEDAIMAPHGVYRSRGPQAWVSVAVETDEEWRALTRVIGRPELADAPEFGDPFVRWQRRAELDELLGAWTNSLTPEEAAERLQEAGVPAAPSRSARDVVGDLDLGAPWELSKSCGGIPNGASGADSGQLLLEELLGLDPGRIAELQRDGVVG